MKNKFAIIKKRAEFVSIGRCGSCAKTPNIVVVCSRSNPEGDTIRVGYTASKRVGGAVDRNKAKRRLRTLVRLCTPEIAMGNSFVFIATANTPSCDFQALLSDFLYCVKKAKDREDAR